MSSHDTVRGMLNDWPYNTESETAKRKAIDGDWKFLPIEKIHVGMTATCFGWTDRYAYEVIDKTAKTLVVRALEVEIDPNWRPIFLSGGFSAHCTNQEEQRWLMRKAPLSGARMDRLRLTKKGWKGQRGLYGIGAALPFHDYNF